jgi:hypothetical protein
MSELHPPQTGVEEIMEEELGNLPANHDEAVKAGFLEPSRKPAKKGPADAAVEEAMHLDQ